MAVPNIFGTATAAIPLSQLDTNFATPVTIGNTAVQLGNTVTSFGNVTLTNVTISSGNVTVTGANVSGTANVSTLIVTGNQTFTGTGNRITGDFSNATIANRVFFQTSTTNGATTFGIVPNGTGTTANFASYGNSADLANSSIMFVGVSSSGTEVRLNSAISGTGTYLPMTFYTGGSERMRIDTSGNLGIGTSSPAVKLDVNGITGWGGATTGQTAQIVGASSGIGGGGNFRVLSNTTQAADVGGVLTLGGYYTSTTNSIDFGAILGAKENSTGGNTAGYLAFGTRVNAGNMTERMRIDSSGNLQFNSGYGSVAVAYGCRAWCQYNGSRTIVGSGNITSITVNGTGDSTLNFTTAMPDANYSAVATTNEDGGTAKFCNATQPSTTTIRVVTYTLAGLTTNNTYNFVAVFR